MLALAVLLMAVLVLGCTEHDDNLQGLQSDEITFSPEIVNNWNVTRSVMQQNATAKVQQLGNGLYLHTVASPGFESDRQQEKMTRGVKYTDTGFANTDSFYVSGYQYGSSETVGSVATANFLKSAKIKKVDGLWRSSQTYTIPYAGDKIDFFAWYLQAGTEGVGADNAQGGTKLTYTVSADISKQPDLLTAVCRNETFEDPANYKVGLPFSHALTAVKFVMDENVAPCSIKEIAFLNVYTKATLTIGGTWDFTNGSTGAIYTLDFATVDGNNELMDEDHRTILDGLMMIPQSFTNDNQIIQVKILINGESELRTLFANLTGTHWDAGTTVTYKISTSEVNALRVSEVTYPDSWSTASTAFSSIKSSYVATDDVLGVYAIDVNGTVKIENMPLTKTANGWSHNILFAPNLTYFAYYPYSSDGLAHSGTKDSQVVATAEDFFASGISAWTPAEDQNSAAELNVQDLQVGTGTVESASTVSFAMAHTMGLASLTLAQGTIPEVRYFIVNASGNINENGVAGTDYIDIGEKSVDASTDFTTTGIENINTKMLVNGRKYYYVVNPRQTAITLNGPTEGDGRWTTPNVELDVTAGNYKNYSVNHQGAYYYKGWLYQYRGYYQTFTVPATGEYRIECWGASSYEKGMVGSAQATSPDVPGRGGYVKGCINLDKDETPTLYIYAGNKGSGTLSSSGGGGGWNGGGNGICVTSYYVGGGGGATDIRLTGANPNTKWNEAASLKTRIMVAGGGGAPGQDSQPGHAGGLEGYRASSSNAGSGYGGKQNQGGSPGSDNWEGGRASSGGFGYGSAGYSHAPGAGSGWYGGAGGTRTTVKDGSAGGGSSFVSGHAGCNPINVSTGTHLGVGAITTINNVEYAFTQIVMIDGAGYSWPATSTSKGNLEQMPNPLGGNYDEGIGHKGVGYVRIASLIPIQ